MSLHKRGRYWHYCTTVNGELVRKSTKLTNKKAAERFYADILQSIQTGQYVPDSQREQRFPRPFEIVVASYLEDRERRGKRTDSYKKLADWSAVFKDRDVTSITLEDVENQLAAWMDKRRWSPTTYNNALSQLSGVFSHCYRKGWIDRHPLKGRAERMTVNNARDGWLRPYVIQALRAEAIEVARRMEHADDRWLANLVSAATFLGLRLEKLTDLRCGDARIEDDDEPWVYVGKDKNGESIDKRIPPGELAEVVAGRLEDSRFPADYLFPGPKGDSAFKAFPKFLKIAFEQVAAENPGWGLEWGSPKVLGHRHGITVHSLRHTMGTLAGNSGASRRTIQTMGNWKTGTMADRYHHEEASQVREAEDRLAELLHITAQSGSKGHSDRKRESA